MVAEQSRIATDGRDSAVMERKATPIIHPAAETRRDEPEWRVSPYCCGIIEEPATEAGDGAPATATRD